MDEHDDDLASEVVEGEEIESDTFDPEEDQIVQSGEDSAESEQAADEDDGEI